MADEAALPKPLDAAVAWKAVAKRAPDWTIGCKLPTPNDKKNGGLITEPAGNLSKEYEASMLPYPPCYSMGSRDAGLLPPPKQPGPGAYPTLSTIEKSHPTEVMTGRGFSWGTTGRSAIGAAMKGPGPMGYKVNSEPALKQVPKWTIAMRRPNIADKEVKPGCTKYKVDGLARDGPITTPCWSLGKRHSGISQTRASWPGPNSYQPPMDANGRRDRKPKWSLYTNERWKPLPQRTD